MAGVPAAVLTRRWQDHWSIQRNVGHLLDLEPLWLGRIDDSPCRPPHCRRRTCSTRKTDEANHNARDLGTLVRGSRDARAELGRQLEQADEADWLRTARHPRLHAEMRLLDHAFFVAEHDDHHLATITEHLRRSD
ncbi:MAG: DinB family protein [Gemmatimonadetes bacterium]|nr:DinB family protein [Gemmatimonadota bacterium]